MSTPVVPAPPRVYAPNPADRYTWGTKVWAGLVGAALALEGYGLWYDRRHPGNRQKWTLSANVRTWGGYDSVTDLPIDVAHGELRRSLLTMFLAWLPYHWTEKRRAVPAPAGER